MKIWAFSDLHLEFGVPFVQPSSVDADVLVCCGDLLTRGVVPSIEWLARHIDPSLPVVFVAGNHEFYRGSVQEGLRDAREVASLYPNLHFLENDAVDISGVRFIGGTLWTDFRITGRDPQLAMAIAQSGMNDFRNIKFEVAISEVQANPRLSQTYGDTSVPRARTDECGRSENRDGYASRSVCPFYIAGFSR